MAKKPNKILNLEKWVSRQNVRRDTSLLREEFSKFGNDNWYIHNMLVRFNLAGKLNNARWLGKQFTEYEDSNILRGLDREQPVMEVLKDKFTFHRYSPQRNMSHKKVFRELIVLSGDEEKEIRELFKKADLVNSEKCYGGDSYYMGPGGECKSFRVNSYWFSPIIDGGKMDEIIINLEKNNDFAALTLHCHGLRCAYRPNSWNHFLAYEFKNNLHCIEKPLDSRIIASDRKKNNIKTVIDKKVVQPGNFLFVYQGQDGSYTFQGLGMFDMFGKLSGMHKNMIDHTLANLDENPEFKCIRIYDGLACAVTMQKKDFWTKEFNKKPREQVLKTLDRRLGAVCDISKLPVVSLLPHTTDKMYLPYENKPLDSTDFYSLL